MIYRSTALNKRFPKVDKRLEWEVRNAAEDKRKEGNKMGREPVAIMGGDDYELRSYAYCCAIAGGNVDHCDCVNKDHGSAWFQVSKRNQLKGNKHG